MLTVGTEWLIEASGCDAEALRDTARLRAVFVRAMRELGLRAVGRQLWHKFPGEGGVTGLVMLTESHLACHTYPEFRTATFNLYCCRERPAWAWDERLREMIGARDVSVRRLERATHAAPTPTLESTTFESSSFENSTFESSTLEGSTFESSSHTAAREGEA